jgi:hypothetical protein
MADHCVLRQGGQAIGGIAYFVRQKTGAVHAAAPDCAGHDAYSLDAAGRVRVPRFDRLGLPAPRWLSRS